jgi:hypothetical protein
MMKKLMMLSLVLGAVALANAGFVVTDSPVLPGEKFNVAFYADEVIIGLSIRQITDTALPSGMISNVVLNDKLTVGRKVGDGLVADGSGVLLSTSGIDGIGGAFNPFGGTKVAAGELLFSFDVTTNAGVAAGDYSVVFDLGTFKNNSSTSIALGSVAYTVVPEPMTMGLLSLGALFLRRRK